MIKFNEKLANQLMDLVRANGFEDRLVNDNAEVSQEALNEALFVLLGVTARISSAYMMNKIRTSNSLPETLGVAEQLVEVAKTNFEMMLANELQGHLERLEALAAMEEKQNLTTTGSKPTTH